MTQLSAKNGRRTLALLFTCFLAAGMVSSFLGVAWPSMRSGFNLPLDALASLLLSTTVGFAIGGTFSGKLIARIGIARFLLLGVVAAGLFLFGNALSPAWWVLVTNGLFVGFAFGAINAGLNIYVAATYSAREMNWLHAMFGVGATIGPLLMAAVIGAGLEWRLGYAVGGIIYLVLGLLFITVQDSMTFGGMNGTATSVEGEPYRPLPLAATLRLPIVLLSILLFLLYTGVEATTGQWTFTLFTESRSVSTYWAGLMTSLFWAMITVGRLVFGTAAGRIGISRLLRFSMGGSVISAALFIVNDQLVGLVAVALMGLSLSAIFPTLISDTPHRVGAQHAATVIGVVTGAASAGSAILPGLAGILAARLGLEILGPYLLGASILMVIVYELTLWLSNRDRPLKVPATNPAPTD